MALSPSSNMETMKTIVHHSMEPGGAPVLSNLSITAIGLHTSYKSSGEDAPRVSPPAVSRKQTPIRPVYDDFATAHSSITSRSANSRLRDHTHKSQKNQTGLLDGGRPLSRRTIKSLRRQKKLRKGDTPSMLVPAQMSNHHPVSEFDFDISETHFTPSSHDSSKSPLVKSLNIAPQMTTSDSPLFDSLKRAVGRKRSHLVKPVQGLHSLTFLWPRGSMVLSSFAPKVDKPIRTALGDDEKETNSPKKLDEFYLPMSPSSMDDPFMSGANHSLSSSQWMCKEYNEALAHNQHREENITCQDNHVLGPVSVESDQIHVTQAQATLGYFHGGIALAPDSQGTISRREGSTVDNIVEQYATNDELWDISLESNNGGNDRENGFSPCSGLDESKHNQGFGYRISELESDIEHDNQLCKFNHMKSSGSAPNNILPQITTLPNQQTMNSTSEELSLSSSYEDTQNLLDVAHHSRRATNSPDLRGDTAPRNSWTALNSIRSFHHGADRSRIALSTVVVDISPNSRPRPKLAPEAGRSTDNLARVPILALERDVSRALRRISALSISSQGIPIHDQRDGGFQSSTDSSDLSGFIRKPIQHGPEPLFTHGFYHESAIRQTWLDSQLIERVRVPIRRGLSTSSSLPTSHLASFASDEFDLEELDERHQNGTEWETVEDGVMSRVKKAGSSLANNSSAGNISPIFYEHNDFASTDRIIQHPAQIDYSHDYRYKEIKDGKFPVLLPSYKPHTVNGFPANSCRSISPFQQTSGDLFQPPPPLSKDHTNPFKSRPPEVITNKSKSSDVVDEDGNLIDQPPKLRIGFHTRVRNSPNSDHWMDEYGDPGPAIKPIASRTIPEATSNSKTSIADSNSESQIIGSSIVSSSALSNMIYDFKRQKNTQKQANSRSSHTANEVNVALRVISGRTPFIKGPPGAFYQGVRSQPDPRGGNLTSGQKATKRVPNRKETPKYPTNQMRPLSLLQIQYPKPVAGGNRSRPVQKLNEDFLYRSPLAPIESRSWCDLYTEEQLHVINTAVSIDGTNSSEPIDHRPSRLPLGEGLKLYGSWKRAWSPHLQPWPRDNSSIITDLFKRKLKISCAIFGLCCLFPPLLLLYGVGYLDSLMLWITKGEVNSFSKAHKKAAIKLIYIFTAVVLIAVPILVLVKTIHSR